MAEFTANSAMFVSGFISRQASLRRSEGARARLFGIPSDRQTHRFALPEFPSGREDGHSANPSDTMQRMDINDKHTQSEGTRRKTPLWVYKGILLLAAAIWGLGTCVIKDTVGAFPAAWLMGLRFTLAGILLFAVCWRRMRNNLTKDTIAAGIVIGFALGPAYLCNTLGLTDTTASKSSFLTSTYVVMVPFIAWVVSKQRPARYNIAAAVLATIGIAFVSFAGGEEASFSFGFGEAITLVSALLLGVHLSISARFSDGRDPLTLTAIQFITGGIIGMIAAFFIDGPLPIASLMQPDVLANLAYLTIFASCIALSLQNIGVAHVPAAPAALFLSCESLFGVAFAILLFGDAITLFMVIGFACIAISIIMSEVYSSKKNPSKASAIEEM